MADSDKELGATRALRKMECKHTHTHTHTRCAINTTRGCSQAGVVKSVMNHQDADSASERKRLEEV